MTDEHHEPSVDPRCIELVELLTEYLEGTLPDEATSRFDEHLETCEGCRAALAQWRNVARLAGRLSVEDIADLDPYIRDRMIATLRIPRRR